MPKTLHKVECAIMIDEIHYWKLGFLLCALYVSFYATIYVQMSNDRVIIGKN